MSFEAEYYGDDAFYPTFQPAQRRNSVIARKPVAGPSTRTHQVSPPSTINEQDEDRISPAPPLPSTHAEFEAVTTPGGSQPFMHYEDYSYFEPEPKGDYTVRERETEALSVEEPRRPERPRQARRKRGQRFPWITEILWLLLSVACLIVIVIFLWKYDEKPLKHCPKDITLNTFVAFFLALCQAGFILPVIEGMSQLKWNWFSRAERPLTDLQIFEDATRGLEGSLRLLVSTQGRILSKVAAVVLLTSLVTSPLTQALINYSTRLVQDDNGVALAPTSEIYPDTNASESGGTLDIRQKQAVQQGIYNPVSVPLSTIQPACSSGECRWDSFLSLGVCVEMNDVTGYLEVSKFIDASDLGLKLAADAQVRNASLSSGAYLLGGTSTYNLNISFPYARAVGKGSTDPREQTLSYIEQPDLLNTALADFFVIYTNDTQGSVAAPFRAVEILMHFCVNTYSVSVIDGVAETTRLASGANITVAQESGGGSGTSGSSDTVTITGDGKNFTVNSTYALLLGDYLKETLSGTYSVRLGDQAVGRTGPSDAVGTALYLSDFLQEITTSNNDALRRQAIRNITENVAASLSNTIREQGTTETGTVLVIEAYVCVRWVWLACVGAQIVMSAMFLVGVMIQTSVWDVKVLKSSALATMLALNADDKGRLERENLGQLTQPRTMGERLKAAKARFAVQDDGSWSLNLGSGHEAVG